MNPLASAASAQYQSLFGVIAVPFWLSVVSFLAFSLMVPAGVIALIMGEKKATKWVGALIAVVAVTQASIIIPSVSGQQDDLDARISANIQQKYGATLDKNSEQPRLEENLPAPFKYTLDFPDGAKGEYTLRFDRNTSEPFVVTTPTPDQLEQNAHK